MDLNTFCTGSALRDPLTAHLLRTMKIIAAIMLIFSLHVTAKSVSQTITLSAKSIALKNVFTEIRKQTGYSIIYNKEIVDDAKTISVNANDQPLLQFLDQLTKTEQLNYAIENKTIFLEKQTTKQRRKSSNAPPIDVRGRLVDEEGTPVQGASVQVKGTDKITVTNENGEFVIYEVEERSTLVFTATNIEKREVNLDGKGDLNILTVKKKVSPLDEVQIIAYGQTSKRLQTGNVTTIKGAEIEKQPVINPLLALQGRVPGLSITQSTGLPGSGVKVRIQGQNSIRSGNDPLYVIDGVPFLSQLLPTLSNILGGSGNTSPNIPAGAGNPLSFINPADIESIEVLKDADATSIYGSRAANGAILITTKKGKTGPSDITISIQKGWGGVGRELDLLNTQQYVQMRNEALKNDGMSAPGESDYDINGFWDITRNTDWQKELIGNTAQFTDIHSSLSSGNSNLKFLLSGGYHRETTVFPGDFNDQRGSIHIDVTNISTNQRFKANFSANYLVDNNRLATEDLTGTAVTLAPNAPPLYNSDGTMNWAPNDFGNTTWSSGNPLAALFNKYNNKTTNLIGNANLSYRILPGLTFKTNFGYTHLLSNETQVVPLMSKAPENRPNEVRVAVYGTSKSTSSIIEPQLLYEKKLGRLSFETLFGTTIHQSNNTNQQIFGIGYSSDLVLEDIKSASTVIPVQNLISVYRYNAGFGRLKLNCDDKYLMDLTARRDGSSRFGTENQFHNFGAVGFAWLISNESFIKQSLPTVSFAKIRGSYGTTGNDLIGDYKFLNLFTPITGAVGVPYQGSIGIRPIGLSNPYLQWEETKKLQFGLDLGFFNDKVLINANFFRNRSSNQLLLYALPIVTGFQDITRNFPATVVNKGWELSVTSVNFRTKRFTWSTSFNLTIPTNELVKFDNLATSSYSDMLVIGESINVQKVYKFLGVDPATGVYQISDVHGNITSNPDYFIDRTIFMNTDPKLYGGLQNRFQYRNFTFESLFQFVRQMAPNYYFGNIVGAVFNSNQPVTVLDRWQKPGDEATIQRYNSDFSIFGSAINAQLSEAGYSDASFIRLKSVSLSWQLPDFLKTRATFKMAEVYIHAQNLLTITNYKGMDPETISTTTLPPLRIITAGIRVSL